MHVCDIRSHCYVKVNGLYNKIVGVLQKFVNKTTNQVGGMRTN